MSDLRNWLERVGDKIPGYGGYADRERRRDADKAHREQLADRLRATKQPLNDVIRELTSSGHLSKVGAADRIAKKIDKAEQRLRFATYGYTGFFDAVEINAPQLDAIYQFDLALVEQIEEIARLVSEYQNKVADESYLPTELDGAVDKFNHTLDERTRVLDNFRQTEGSDDGDSTPPGHPMFS